MELIALISCSVDIAYYIHRFAITVPLINCATSIYAGFVVFAVLGYMAHEAGVDVKDVVNSGKLSDGFPMIK